MRPGWLLFLKTPFHNKIVVVGDLNGCAPALFQNLKSAGVVDDEGHWTACAHTQLVILGDLVCDRLTTGIPLLKFMHRLTQEIAAIGGPKPIKLAGNHDEWAISFLLGKPISNRNDVLMDTPIVQCIVNEGQGIGVLEFAQFGGHPLEPLWHAIDEKQAPPPPVNESGVTYLLKGVKPRIPDTSNIYAMLHVLHRQIVKGLPDDVRSELTDLQLVHRSGPLLFCHTPPTAAMFRELLECDSLNANISRVNQSFQKITHACLGKNKRYRWRPKRYRIPFEELSEIFLATDNRVHELTESWASQLTKQGITHILYGHNNRDPAAKQKDPAAFHVNNVELVPVDYGYLPVKELDHLRSIAVVDSDGRLHVGKDAVEAFSTQTVENTCLQCA